MRPRASRDGLVAMKATLGVAALLVVSAGTTLGLREVLGQDTDACSKCKPAKGEWSWKANGYAIGADKDEATTASEASAIAKACKASQPYLDGMKLKCKGNCNAGELSEECKPEKPPACDKGTYAENSGQWTFICRKMNEDRDTKVSCDKEEAQRNPGYSMCDVSTKAVRTLACSHPDCQN
jgi:hypothetical protein